MIMLDEQIIESEDDIERVKQSLEKFFEENDRTELYPIFEKFFDDCCDGDIKLQKLVSEKISGDLTSFLIIPFEENANYNEFNFILASNDGRSVKRKEEKLYQKFAHECFKDIQPIEARVIAFEERNRRLYI